MEKQECNNCKYFRLSEILNKRMCDFWERELIGEILVCIAWKEKNKEDE